MIVCLLQSNRRNSFGQLKQKNLSPSTSTQSSEEDFLSSPRTKSKPCDIICSISKATPTRKPPSGRARPTTSSDVRDDLGEEERQKWRKFREKKVSYRSAVLKVHPRKPRQNPSEPSECSAPTKLHFFTTLGPMLFIHSSFSCAVQWRGRRGWGRRRRQPGGGTRDLWPCPGRRPEIDVLSHWQGVNKKPKFILKPKSSDKPEQQQ